MPEDNEPLAAVPWRNCKASLALVAEVNERWPCRDKASDGTIGDTAHSANWTSSDHNPWVVVDGTGIVRARDVDTDGIDAPWLAEYLRKRGAAGDPRLRGGGYVIYNRKITGAADFTAWRAYTGTDPHTGHIHVSFSRDAAGYDSTAAWGIYPAQATALRLGDSGDEVKRLQNVLKAWYPAVEPYKSLVADGQFGAKTEAAVRAFQGRAGLEVDGIAGRLTLAALGIAL